MDLQIANVINISVAATPSGVNQFNTSNLALFTSEAPGSPFSSGYKIYLEPTEVGADFGTSSVTYQMALEIFSQAPNVLSASGYLVIIPLLTSPSLETVAAAITRTKNLVQYFGVIAEVIESQSDMLAAAAVLQAQFKIGFFAQRASASIDSGGSLDLLRTGGFTHSRGLYYGSAADTAALLFQAAYAGRALSTNFSGSNTTQTMQLKDLPGIQPDPSMTQTLYDKAQAAGADVYASIDGTPKVLTTGANAFFDQVYNLMWFVTALQTAGFNYLAQTATKIPQTEGGMDGLKSAYRGVCVQANTNRYSAPGTWNSPTVFGIPGDLLANISQYGYYVYSQPIAQQSQADRADRKAPLVQIALKEAGAIHKSSVIVNVNA